MNKSTPAWLPIETAPKDGTVIDLYTAGEFASRYTDCFWGKPDHCCGEDGQYCDSDWHSAKPGWVDATFNDFLCEAPTHWMKTPASPDNEKQTENEIKPNLPSLWCMSEQSLIDEVITVRKDKAIIDWIEKDAGHRCDALAEKWSAIPGSFRDAANALMNEGGK